MFAIFIVKSTFLSLKFIIFVHKLSSTEKRSRKEKKNKKVKKAERKNL